MRATPIDLNELIGQRSLSRRALLFAAGSGATLAVAGSTNVVAQETTARVRFVNAMLPAAPVDITIDAVLMAENLAFGEASKILEVPAAAFTALATPHGDDSGSRAVSQYFDLTAGFTYEIVVLPESMVRVGVLLTAIDQGLARLRMIHASPDTGAVGLRISQGDVLLETIQYPDASQYLMLPAGAIDLEILGSPSQRGLPGAPGTPLTGRKVHHLYFIGWESDQSLQLLMTSWWAERGTPQDPVQLTDAEFEYLEVMEAVTSLVERSMRSLDSILNVSMLGSEQLGALAGIFMSWVVAEESIRVVAVPARYQELHSAFTLAIEPLANLARQISGATATLTGSDQRYSLVTRIDFLAIEGSSSMISSRTSMSGRNLSALLDNFRFFMETSLPATDEADEAGAADEDTYLRRLMQPVFDAAPLLEQAHVKLELALQEAGSAPF